MHKYPDEAETLRALVRSANLSPADRSRIAASGAELVQTIREAGHPGLMEVFLAEYGLSTDEGIALMCLAEALLRVPDAVTIDTLIEDKIAPSDWGKHLGHSSSSLVNASTWALMLTGKVLQDGRGLAHVLQERDGEHRGTFLPAVWESLPEPADFLRELKRKAGLAPDYWSATLQVERYTTESFS